MNITSDELYEAIRVSYQSFKDNPEDFSGIDDTLEDIEGSAASLLSTYQGIIQAYRANNK